MGRMLLLYDNQADAGTFAAGYGDWSLPLAYMQDPRPTRRARSANLDPASTRFRIALNTELIAKAVVFGPCNFSAGGSYRIKAFLDPDYAQEVFDSGVQVVGPPPVASLDLEWEDANFWTGAQQIEDPDGAGIYAIFVGMNDVVAQYWQVEIFDVTNPDGFIEIGRLFLGTAWQPSVNYAPESNSFGFEPNTTVQRALGGTRYYNRRKSARTFAFAFPVLPEDEAWTDVYRIAALAGIDRQVFLIPDPDDGVHRNKRSFLGNLSSLPAIALFNLGNASTGFAVTEAL